MADKEFTERDLKGELSDIETKSASAAGQAALAVVGGAIPFAGGLAGWLHDKWSGKEQEQANQLFLAWFKMLQDEFREKARVMGEIMARLDMEDSATSDRVTSPEYQVLVRKAFRNWSGAESDKKQRVVRNILANSAQSSICSDDVVSLFLDWIANYSELHFGVISAIYNADGITRGEIWRKMNKPSVREDSADADMFKLLFRDLSTGGIIRQHREKDYQGNFVKKRKQPGSRSNSTMKSAFDETEGYELTALGQQFVHYALTDIPPKIAFDPDQDL